MSPDVINGLYEALGCVFIYMSIRKLRQDKIVRGVSWLHMSFCMTWGFWNLFYYPHLEQWYSFWGGVGIVTANTYYVFQLLYYDRLETKAEAKRFVKALYDARDEEEERYSRRADLARRATLYSQVNRRG